MSLPDLDADGDLPVGVHRATLQEVLSRFGVGTPQRVQVAGRLTRIVELASRTGSLEQVVLFGSFVTDKPEPRDVDIILIMRDDFDLTRCPADTPTLSTTPARNSNLARAYSGFVQACCFSKH
ncbi:MAG: nucleotidyltransferase domain-containing protein [Pirellulaceae bacterium]